MKKNKWNAIFTRGLFLISFGISFSFVFHIPLDAQKSLSLLTAQSNLANNQQTLPYNIYLPSISKTCACYYIDNNSGSDSNSGTQSDKPWKTLSKLNRVNLQPGDTVYLKRGSIWTEKLPLSASGQAGKPIIITAYGSGVAPILSNPGDSNNDENVLSLHGSFIVIDNLHIQDSGTGISIFSDHNIVQNSEIMNTGTGIAILGQYNLITHNYIHDMRMVVNTPGIYGDDWGANGIDINNAHNEISFNRFVNTEAPSYDYGMGGGAVEIYGIGDYTSIHHNLVLRSAGFMEVSSTGTGSATNVTISYNVVINATRFTYIHVTSTSAIRIKDFRVENNTLIDLRTHDPFPGNYIGFNGAPSPDSYILRNNIIYISDYWWVSSYQFTHQNNLYYLLNPHTHLGFTLRPDELLMVDPQFVDLANYDFHLKSTSPAINAGINLGYTEDFDLNPVPVGSVPDLGAFEYHGN